MMHFIFLALIVLGDVLLHWLGEGGDGPPFLLESFGWWITWQSCTQFYFTPLTLMTNNALRLRTSATFYSPFFLHSTACHWHFCCRCHYCQCNIQSAVIKGLCYYEWQKLLSTNCGPMGQLGFYVLRVNHVTKVALQASVVTPGRRKGGWVQIYFEV